MPIDALPDAPLPTDSRATFSAKQFPFQASLALFRTQANALEANVNAKEASAAASAATATAAAASAAASSGATQWVSGPYNAGAVVWSPVDKQTYRKNSTGTTSTDPSADGANWTRLTYTGQILNQVSATAVAGAYGNSYALNNVATTVVTLPPAPAAGAAPIGVIPCNGLFTNYLARNGSLIHTKAEDFVLDNPERTYFAVYINATVGWRIY